MLLYIISSEKYNNITEEITEESITNNLKMPNVINPTHIEEQYNYYLIALEL